MDIVKDSPLTVCDIRSVEESDWLLCDQVHDDRIDESMYLRHRPGHKWYWLSNQTRDEMTLFVVFDSENFKDGASIREGERRRCGLWICTRFLMTKYM